MKKSDFADVIPISDNGNVLLLRRSPNSDLFPNTLCIPGGHVDDGEGVDLAAMREMAEETGLIPDGLGYAGWFEFEDGKTTAVFIGMFHNEPTPVLSGEEHTGFVWVHPDDIFEMDADAFCGNHQEIIAKAIYAFAHK